ncbi:GTPase ObgE [bacterium]|nr:GTPase ObgE [bacterium]
MFYDEATIKVKAGDGGNGSSSFRSEKYRAMGGPDGGDGGKGGSVYFKVNPEINTLASFNSVKFYEAPFGINGGKNDRHGSNGEDLFLEVPKGTIVYDKETNEMLFDLTKSDEEIMIAKGGRGGRGNAHFKSSTNQAPKISELGEPGEEREIRFELKLVADVSIIGIPSSGKSTLISVISNARPKIADYPFTTLIPNLGVVVVDNFSFVVVDVPGLIKDAYKGKGLGDAFLRHIERSRMIVHLVDITSKDPVEDYKVIRNELKKYKSELSKKQEIIAINKIDVLGDDKELLDDVVGKIEKVSKKKVYPISAAAKIGINELLYRIKDELKKLPKQEEETEVIKVFKPQERLMQNFSIEKKGEYFIVTGKRIERFASQTNPNSEEGIVRLLKVIDSVKLTKVLEEKGIKEGHLIKIGRRTGRYQNGMIVIVG